MNPERVDRLERAVTWPALAGLAAMLLVMKVVIHRLVTGTWREEPGEWVAWLVGLIAGLGVTRLLGVWIVRRQRTRGRSST